MWPVSSLATLGAAFLVSEYKRFYVDGFRNSLQIFRGMRELGYEGSTTIVVNYVTQLRQYIGEPSDAGPVMRTQPTPLKRVVSSPREIAWWFCLPPARLTEKQQERLRARLAADVELQTVYGLVQAFAGFLKRREVDQFPVWMERALTCNISELKTFAGGLCRDLQAVRAGLEMPWSQGQVEGHVNRLKLIKRQCYGRAKIDLLRIRVLHPTIMQHQK